MSADDRRSKQPTKTSQMEKELNDSQLTTLRNIETFGWELKFIRRPLFQKPIPVVFDGSRQAFAIIEQDGTLNEKPDLKIRD
ncbi:MAG: hypothetical protein R3200_03645 [Xanthomonadales bacterium]|nr:hypothetical protein [Xanthomonadales bacterium]